MWWWKMDQSERMKIISVITNESYRGKKLERSIELTLVALLPNIKKYVKNYEKNNFQVEISVVFFL